ncbi:hypothetical protein H2200_009005 [Cladophialophora chaetospira]|uniref:Uncharacterized protein n=1 Tax=Cladophialophora chaetospira TaxID=386627 RepID=A0AA38X521_9EURO|nr:hypothetical protein H2200_009005 [Cladophialophora chaetospira]
MADVDTTSGLFRFNLSTPSPQKRKRHSDHLDDEDDDSDYGVRDLKRRSTATHRLPFRLSPGRANVSAPPASFSLYTSIYQQPPTPVDTSDDESLGHRSKEDDQWNLTKQESQPQSDSSTSSVKAQCGDLDVDMDMTAPLMVQPRIRRARSNDIIPPERDTNFLGAIEHFARERVPTPISSHFDNRVSDLPNVPRHSFPPLRTNLSPMIEQESWISRDGLPSPVEDHDMDMVMDRDESTGHVYPRTRQYGLDGNYSPSGRARTGRLHMGYLNGCEKCAQKVPGHYSHIIWT